MIAAPQAIGDDILRRKLWIECQRQSLRYGRNRHATAKHLVLRLQRRATSGAGLIRAADLRVRVAEAVKDVGTGRTQCDRVIAPLDRGGKFARAKVKYAEVLVHRRAIWEAFRALGQGRDAIPDAFAIVQHQAEEQEVIRQQCVGLTRLGDNPVLQRDRFVERPAPIGRARRVAQLFQLLQRHAAVINCANSFGIVSIG